MIDKFWTWWKSTEVNQSKIDIDELFKRKMKYQSLLIAIKDICDNPTQNNPDCITRIGNIAGEALNDK